MEEIMDEQREWLNVRRKSRLRIMAVILCICLTVTTYPEILAAFSASATEQGDSTVYVTGFGELPETVREQTVPLGTAIEELTLPDKLEACAAGKDAKNEGGGNAARRTGKRQGRRG